MSAAVLTSLSDLCYERGAMLNGAAMADTEFWLMLEYIYDGYVKLNYHTGMPCSRAATGRTRTRFLCAVWLARARL